MISHLTKTAATLGVFAVMTGAAHAGCNNSLYCSGSVHAYESAPASSYSVTLPGTHVSAPASYGASSPSVTLPGTHNVTTSYGGVASDAYADAVYGSGSISGAYVDHSTVGSTYTSSTVSNITLPGLGLNERLCPTACASGGTDTAGNRVLGCYKVCQPVQPVRVQNYVKVVRPVVYVRYPVVQPQVPVCGPTWRSRYGGHGCGW